MSRISLGEINDYERKTHAAPLAAQVSEQPGTRSSIFLGPLFLGLLGGVGNASGVHPTGVF
ncbi:MAG TPA: hypothetical protein VGI23_14045, partial [Steroidobacteraceae bacterium]